MTATSVSPDARRIWLAARAPLAIVALIVAGGIVAALAKGGSQGGALDPRSAAPDGSRALANLLDEHGVQVELVQTAAAAEDELASGDATLLLTTPGLLEPADARRISANAAEVVVLAPEQDTVQVLAPGTEVAGHPDEQLRNPGCDWAPAAAAGEASAGGVGYRAEGKASTAQQCYPTDDGAALLHVTGDRAPVTLLGTATPLTNAALATEGNAALAMRLLGTHERLVFYIPSPGDPSLRQGDQSLAELLPVGWKFGLIQLAIAAVCFALWRARRLGPVVSEPLPVVVRAAETTEGRARLYLKAGAADHAAEALRAAARSRIATRLGLTADAEPDAVVVAAAARTGRAQPDVGQLLYGPAPTDDDALVRIADALDRLENEVRTP
ncbi:MAG: DUF4350 domain-containing protein [Actinophytocola sp.]|nr:DUF4350 domain-containing protein [Actinophytocola sp.]